MCVCVYVFCFGCSFESMKQLCERYNRAVANIKKLVRFLKGMVEKGREGGEGTESESEVGGERERERKGRGFDL